MNTVDACAISGDKDAPLDRNARSAPPIDPDNRAGAMRNFIGGEQLQQEMLGLLSIMRSNELFLSCRCCAWRC